MMLVGFPLILLGVLAIVRRDRFGVFIAASCSAVFATNVNLRVKTSHL